MKTTPKLYTTNTTFFPTSENSVSCEMQMTDLVLFGCFPSAARDATCNSRTENACYTKRSLCCGRGTGIKEDSNKRGVGETIRPSRFMASSPHPADPRCSVAVADPRCCWTAHCEHGASGQTE